MAKIKLSQIKAILARDLKLKYKRSIFGFAWSVLNPVAFLSIYLFVFSKVLKVDIQNYPLYLVTGMLPWLWISGSLVAGCNCIVNNGGLIRKIGVSPLVFPLTVILVESLNFVVLLPLVMLYSLYVGVAQGVTELLLVIPFFFLQVAILYPFVLILAVANAYVRDIEHILNIFLSIVFYLTPIVYTVQMVPREYSVFFQFNIIASNLDIWRTLLGYSRGDVASDLFLIFSALSIAAVLIFIIRKKINYVSDML